MAEFTTILYSGIAITVIVAMIREYLRQRAAYVELEKLFQQRKTEAERFNLIPYSAKKFRRIPCSKIKVD